LDDIGLGRLVIPTCQWGILGVDDSRGTPEMEKKYGEVRVRPHNEALFEAVAR